MHKTYKCDNTQRCKIVEVSRVAIPCWAVAKPEAPPGDTLIGPRCGEHC